jgi:hypothetical protein
MSTTPGQLPADPAARHQALARAYGQPAESTRAALNAAHATAQRSRFAASPSFAALLEQAIAHVHAKHGGRS